MFIYMNVFLLFIRFQRVVCAARWLSGAQTVMISLPPLPDRPSFFCGGKGWFNSSQPRALQHS